MTDTPSLVFTSGSTRPQETRVVDAVMARLKRLHRDAGMFLAHVGEAPAMPSRITGEDWDLMLREMNTRAPAALVIIDSARTSAGGMNARRSHWRRTYDVTIAVFSNHRRDTVAGRLNPDHVSTTDATKDPGLRATCELIDTLLLGFPLSADEPGAAATGVAEAYDVEPGNAGMQTVYAGALGTLRELHYTIEADIERDNWPDMDHYLESIHTTLAGAVGLAMETEL